MQGHHRNLYLRLPQPSLGNLRPDPTKLYVHLVQLFLHDPCSPGNKSQGECHGGLQCDRRSVPILAPFHYRLEFIRNTPAQCHSSYILRVVGRLLVGRHTWTLTRTPLPQHRTRRKTTTIQCMGLGERPERARCTLE
ncbi:hypothetical protein PMIN02_003937 [Paraphaeosphaeria minitans]